MLSPRDLLAAPVTYDIVVSDFGRDATIEYLRLVSTLEKRFIVSILDQQKRAFFDEYRRIMFTTIGDVAFFKAQAIAEETKSVGYLTEDVLIGLGPTPTSQEFIDRVAFCVVQEALAALDRGHRRLRVMIPCNGLSRIAMEIGRVISSDADLKRLAERSKSPMPNFDRVATAGINVFTVPEAVVRHLAAPQEASRRMHVLVLGTPGTHAMYEEMSAACGIKILPIEKDEYDLIDRTIVASIGNDPAEVAACRENLQNKLIEPRRQLFGRDLIILEACTDFRLELGLSSLELFAEAMVSDCYRTIVPSRNEA